RFGPRPLARYAADLIVPRRLAAEVAVLKAIAFYYVMNDPEHQARKQRQQEILSGLVDVLVDRDGAALSPIFADFYDAADGDAARLRVILDQVSLLTDSQATAWHHRLVS